MTNFPARVKEEQLEEQLVEQLEALSRDIKRAKVLEGPKGLYVVLKPCLVKKYSKTSMAGNSWFIYRISSLIRRYF